jgi:hypothetical protein
MHKTKHNKEMQPWYDQVHEVFETVTKHISLCIKVFYRFFLLVCIGLQLSRTLKIKNMRFMNLMMVYDFIQVPGIKVDYLTKDGYFSKQQGFIMIYLL